MNYKFKLSNNYTGTTDIDREHFEELYLLDGIKIVEWKENE